MSERVSSSIESHLTFAKWLSDAEPGQEWAFRNAWYQEQAYLWIHLDYDGFKQYRERLRQMPVLVIHDYGYVNSVRVGDYLGCAVGLSPSVLQVVSMPTRKKLNLQVVDGPQGAKKYPFPWKRDLLLPFWSDGRQRRLF